MLHFLPCHLSYEKNRLSAAYSNGVDGGNGGKGAARGIRECKKMVKMDRSRGVKINILCKVSIISYLKYFPLQYNEMKSITPRLTSFFICHYIIFIAFSDGSG